MLIRAALGADRVSRQRINRILEDCQSKIRVFHGTRTADVSTFYRDGLRLADHSTQRQRARAIFGSRDFPELTDQRLAQAMRDDAGSVDDHRAYVVLDREELLETAGHYLIYGSEYLCGVAAALTGPTTPDYRQALKRYGVPHLLTLDVPLPLLPQDQIANFCARVSRRLSSVVQTGHVPPIDFTFILHNPLPPSTIVQHEVIHEVKDPLLDRLYRFRTPGPVRIASAD